MRGCGAQTGSGKGEILTVKEAAPMGHVCSLHKELRSPLIPFRYGRTSSGGERMEVGKRRKGKKKNPRAHTQQNGAALPLARSPSPP